MTQRPTNPRSLAIFCKVVDNFGDIGICWRLARQLDCEHGIAVELWVDDLCSFRRICPDVVGDADIQQLGKVMVRHWRDQEGQFRPDEVADVVIEFFGCDIPPGYIAAMAQRTPRAVWLNLEGLSAEEWVEGCHRLPSPHPRLPLTKHFFFPGFTRQTGGLLREVGLAEQRRRFQSNEVAVRSFLEQLGLFPAELDGLKISLFCYPHAPLGELFDVWVRSPVAITSLVPEGVATDAIAAFLGVQAKAGAVRTVGALTLRVLPFVAQPDYDRLLWACDLNFVRGEDSFVRAQWAGQPFVWHIYPQDENLHHKKLRAFLQRYADSDESLAAFSLRWNDAKQEGGELATLWHRLYLAMPGLKSRAERWEQSILENGDLANNLLDFCAAVRSDAAQSNV
ncbi:MAG TPA: elongation factor P maturation arginine rhamnosyltransferase EarP [Noviherbaspirillum sp.]